MRKQYRNTLMLAGTILGLLAVAYPFFSSMAQKTFNQKYPSQDEALKVIRQNAVSNVFYETLKSQESGWILIKADQLRGGEVVTPRGVGQDPDSIHLVLKKDKSEVRMTLYEYTSVDEAKLRPRTSVSAGEIKGCKGDECGDEGEKIYAAYSKDMALIFRKGRFFIEIYCDSEEAAKRLARYALVAVANR